MIVHTNNIHIMKSGKVVLIASIVDTNIDDSMSIFDEQGEDEEPVLDDHSTTKVQTYDIS